MGSISVRHLLALVQLASVASAASLSAQSADPLPALDEYHVRDFGPEDGLPVSEVRDLDQGPSGHIYLATARGLARYDGYAFAPVTLPGFASEVLLAIHADRRGRLWIVSEAGDVGYLERGRLRLLPRLARAANQIHETPDGTVWLGGEAGLMRISPSSPPTTERVGPEHGLPDGPVSGPYRMGDGSLLVVAGDRPYRIEPEPVSGGLRAKPLARSMREIPGSHFRSDSVALRLHLQGSGPGDAGGRAAAAAVGVDRLGRPPGGRAVLRSELQGRDGARWLDVFLGEEGKSHLVRSIDGRARALKLRRYLDFNSISALFEDHEGSLWVGTNLGLVQLVPRRVLALTERHGLAEGFTVPVVQTEDADVWVGTWGGGLHRFAGGRLASRLTEDDGLPSDRIRALHLAADGGLWVGANGGMAELRDGRLVRTQEVAGEARDFTETPDGRFWAGGTHGLYLRSRGGFSAYRPDVLGGLSVWALHTDRAGALWIGTEEGLFRLVGDSLVSFGAESGLRSGFVVSIHEEEDGTLWFGTYARGLHRYRGRRFVPVTTGEGLLHDGVWAMLADGDGGLWMSSDGGIFRVDRRRLHAIADAVERGERPASPLEPLVFTEAEGMPTRECNRASPGGWRLADGRLLFNNLRGLIVIDPERATAAPPPPPTDVAEVLADGRPVEAAGEDPVRLPAGTRHLAFEFAALSFVSPEQNRYRYRLEGYDEGWIAGGTRSRASYTNLPPGRYVFRVQAASGTGDWGEPGARHAFVVPPVVWETWWFRGLVGLAVVLLLVVAYRYRVAHLLAMERLRLRIAADLHDDVGSNLSSIALLSQILEERGSLQGLEGRQLRRIHEAADETIASLRDIIWLVDPGNDDLGDLVRRMRKVASELLEGRDHTFRPPEADGLRPLGLPLMRNAFLVYKEALHNAARHARESSVEIEVGAGNGELRFRIRDDGPGFDPAAVSRGHGLVNMRRRAEEVGGRLEVVTAPGEGTTVTFAAPMA